MGELASKFSRDDIETLIEATDDWESVGNQEYHIMNLVRNAPMPPEDNEAFEVWQQVKDHFRRREKEIRDSRATRQERAVFLKAKLMLVRRDMGINQLFEMATTETAPTSTTPTIPAQGLPSEDDRLKRAEFFIRDLGVWDHYQKFLQEQQV